MKTRLILSAFLLTILGVANAKPESFELNLSDVRLPVSASGMITFRACDECRFQQAMAAPNATWILNDTTTSFDKLRDSAARSGKRDRSIVTLTYDAETNRITALKVRIR